MSQTPSLCGNVSLDIEEKDLIELLNLFAKDPYYAHYETPEGTTIMKRCIEFMSQDYNIIVINNKKGSLCTTYPSHIPIQVYSLESQNANPPFAKTIHEDYYDPSEIYNMFKVSNGARCRERFAVPVILYKGKYICRSATLACGCEIFGRKGVDLVKTVIPGASTGSEEAVCSAFCCDNSQCQNPANKDNSNSNLPSISNSNIQHTESQKASIFQAHNMLRSADIKLLRKFYVGSIVDLMVENKKSKMFVTVSSSEKVDKEGRYNEFNLISLPYPGCEHFTRFRDSNYDAVGLKFDWDPSVCDANINVPDFPSLDHLNINWNEFKDWDLVKMTQNYLKYLLKYLQDSSSGMLIHCISGWDRTPLFISLLRLSLWADGAIHQSMNEYQMLYFTVAYDWFLFSHKLQARMANKEAIFFFCFYMLKYIFEDDFSVVPRNRSRRSESSQVSDKTDNQDILLESDLGSNGSSDSQTDDNNGNANSSPVMNFEPSSPQSKRSPIQRTSPVQVPSPRIRRTEPSISSSMQSTQSWQFVTGTGSLAGSEMGDSEPTSPRSPLTPPCRKSRLNNVRQLFYKCFFRTVGKEVNFPSSSIMGNFI